MLNKVIDYKILSGKEAPMLENQVKELLNAGWAPSGPVFDHRDMLNQAMVLFG